MNIEFIPDPTKDWCFNSQYIKNGCYRIPLDKYENKTVRIKFTSIANYQNNLFLDNIKISDTLSASINSSQPYLDIYPNPAKEYIIVKTKTPIKIKIMDVLGNTLMTHTVSVPEKLINVGELPPGVYFIEAYTSKLVSIRKLIIL